jgi:hypothetical protein
MSEAYAAAHIAQELGITVLADDVPKIVAAIHRAYAVGQRDGAAAERDACAHIAKAVSDKYAIGYYGNEVDTADEIESSIRARGAA